MHQRTDGHHRESEKTAYRVGLKSVIKNITLATNNGIDGWKDME